VFAAVRNVDKYPDLAALGLRIYPYTQPGLPEKSTVIYTLPPLPPGEREEIRSFLYGISPRRFLYISATSVYGNQTHVTADTPVDTRAEKALKRIEDEIWVESGPWSSLIIRPAAIYGPGRGVHVRVKEGRALRSSGIVSRIHVDDLAAVLEAGIFSDLIGTWPIADDRPCRSLEISTWCARLLRLPPPNAAPEPLEIGGREVDGSQIRELLGVRLAYPTYEAGILASLASESAG